MNAYTEKDENIIYGIIDALRVEIDKAITGKRRETALLIASMIAGGHVLIEDVPGVGKTTLASAFAKAAGLSFKRAQFTPDVMASDITGFNIYNRKTESFEFRDGLVNTNILLADEINRAAPKTQSSLLEAMEERQVTVDGTTYKTPDPFMVIATQNPSGFVGTYPLPEAQLDRFAVRIKLGYPTPDEERIILRKRMSGDPMNSVTSVCTKAQIALLRAFSETVAISPDIEQYIVSLVTATREKSELSLGASPRASVALMKLSRAWAMIKHRNFVTPEDVAELFRSTVSHRIVLTREAAASGKTDESVLSSVLSTTSVPFYKKKQ